MLAAREALAAEPGADAGVTVDVGRSLTAVAGLLEATGKTDEALAAYRRSEALLAGPAGSDPAARAALAACRSRLGWLLSDHGPDRRGAGGLPAGAGRPGGAGRRPRGLERRPPRPGGHGPPHRRPAGGDGQAGGGGGRVPHGRWRSARSWPTTTPPSPNSAAAWRTATTTSASCCRETGRPAEAEAEFRTALALHQKLAEDNPAVTEFRSGLAHSHHEPRPSCWRQTGRPAEAEAEFRTALAIYQKLADDNPAVTEFRSGLALCLKHFAALQAWFGQDAEWRTTCRRALEYARNGDHFTLEQVSSACCLRPSADPEQLKTALDLARRAVKLDKGKWGYDWRQMALGMAEYRNGRYAEADKTLAAAAETGAEPPGADHVGVLPRHELVQAGPGRGGPPACAGGRRADEAAAAGRQEPWPAARTTTT